MAQSRHYSPAMSRFMVSVLYHEAKARSIPMTQLTDQLLRQALIDSRGWKIAESTKQEISTTVPMSAQTA